MGKHFLGFKSQPPRAGNTRVGVSFAVYPDSGGNQALFKDPHRTNGAKFPFVTKNSGGS